MVGNKPYNATSVSKDCHESRRATLEVVARAAGFHRTVPSALVAGLRPDVLLATTRGLLFLGEAKHTELPDCLATLDRLLSYLLALRPYCFRIGREHLVVVCFRGAHLGARWTSTLLTASADAGFYAIRQGGIALNDDTGIAWIGVSAQRSAEDQMPSNRA